MTNKELIDLGSGTTKATIKGLRRVARSGDKTIRGSWAYYAIRLLGFLIALESGQASVTPFRIFGKGNAKLPWTTFSSLAVADCPGAGECRDWCYSLKALRYPGAAFRQVQNSHLLRSEHGRALVKNGWHKLKPGTVRLYVDGDFNDATTLNWWMDRCRERPDLSVYGYSKSLELFLGYTGAWPRNYTVNASSGHRYSPAVEAAFRELDPVRGTFSAIESAEKRKIDEPFTQRQRQQILREARDAGHTGPLFACPGLCGQCLPNGEHGCGSASLANVGIVIPNHGR